MIIASDEKLLRRERVHAGIFALPVIASVLLLIGSALVVVPIGLFLRLVLAPPPMLAFIVFLPEILIAIAAMVATLIAYLCSEVVLTDKNLRFRMGFLARLSGEIPLNNVEGLFIVEPLLG